MATSSFFPYASQFNDPEWVRALASGNVEKIVWALGEIDITDTSGDGYVSDLVTQIIAAKDCIPSMLEVIKVVPAGFP